MVSAGDSPVEWCQHSNSEQSPYKGSQRARLDCPLEVHPVLHPPGSDEDAAEGKEEGRNGALGVGAPLDGCLHLTHQKGA